MQGIASHSRVLDVYGDLLRKRTFLRRNLDYTLGASVRNDLMSSYVKKVVRMSKVFVHLFSNSKGLKPLGIGKEVL